MKLVSWSSIVPEVGKGPGRRIEGIWPVLINPGRIEDHEPNGLLRGRAYIPETALVADREEDGKRIVARVPSGPTKINLLNQKIAQGQLFKRDRRRHLSKITHESDNALRRAIRC
jgi:hypothetical protein